MSQYYEAIAVTTKSNLEILRRIARRVMLERNLLPDFGEAALKQLQSISRAAATDGGAVRDLRDLLWCSIDNDDSRDLDQLSVAEPLPAGAVRLWIAIADVDAVVAQDSPIDRHARRNTTSVYTIAEIFPMLPEKLSTDLTSLGEGKERLAMVVDMTFDADATLTASDVYRAEVINHAKLAYDGVAAWLDGTAQAPPRLAAVPGLDRQLRLQDQSAQTLKRQRHARGALGLESIEARPVFDGELLRDLLPDQTNRAKQLIEDFMIAANGVTARFLAARGLPSIRRVLRAPERWDRIVALAAGFEAALPSTPDARALNAFLGQRQRADPAGFPDISLAIIKLLGRGEYALEMPDTQAVGHFALAVSDYAHSTAPNRRFPDLITQRLLKAALDGCAPVYDTTELGALAAHCSAQEDNAAKVERQLRKSAAALLLAPRIGEPFDAIVTGASGKGTWVRILAPTAEGKLIHGFEGLDVGDHVRVALVQTDVERGFIDFKRLG